LNKKKKKKSKSGRTIYTFSTSLIEEKFFRILNQNETKKKIRHCRFETSLDRLKTRGEQEKTIIKRKREKEKRKKRKTRVVRNPKTNKKSKRKKGKKRKKNAEKALFILLAAEFDEFGSNHR